MFKRLVAVWIDYRVHHISEVVTRCLLGALLFSMPVAPVAAHQYTTHHKPQKHHKATTSQPRTKPKTQPSPTKKIVIAKPAVPAGSTPVASSPPPTQTPNTVPVPATQPTPGSGAKTLTPAPALASSPPTSNSSPAGSDSSPTTTSTSSSPPTNSPTPTYASGGYTSTNWAGYVATAGNYKHISSSWVVPSATGNGSSTAADSTWIGIGGVFSDDLIQTGTINSVSASGKVSSSAFYELLPDPALEIPSIAVKPGDSMSATIDELSVSTWKISINDSTTGQSFTTTVSYTSSYSSAEWIEEDPSYTNGSLVPFDNFSPADFTDGQVSINGASSTISTASGSPITLVDQTGNPLARPTILTAEGSGFTVYRQ